DLLVGQVALRVGDPPEAQAAGEMGLMEVEVPLVARVADVPAPDLQGGLGVAHERGRLAGAAPRGGPVGGVGRPLRAPVEVVRLGAQDGAEAGEILAVRGDAAAA